MISEDLKKTISQWKEWNKNPKDQERLSHLLESNDVKFLQKAFGPRLKFGTAGIRAIMDIGTSFINDVSIIQVSQAVSAVASKYNQNKGKVIIGYDGRKNSSHFAKLAANVFSRDGFDVCGFGENTVPTPLVPFSVVLKKACFGVMITASHNPKEYNGYKLYWENGAQILSPIDQEIENALSSHQNILDCNECVQMSDIYDEVVDEYLKQIQSLNFIEPQQQSQPIFTYTAMHGVGYRLAKKAFEQFNLNKVVYVSEQIEPDPEFPTVVFPNPEEGEAVLRLAIQTAEQNGSSVILANDPDADRVALACKINSQWKCYSGNEIGTLLAWWILFNYKGDKSKAHMISTIVSSSIIRSMALKHNFHFHCTLTGFKWMANEAKKILDKGDVVLLAFEEAIGFMCGTIVLDKDGISAAATLAQMIVYLHNQNNKNPDDQLNEIYAEYGLHLCRTIYCLSYNPQDTIEMFDRIRHFNDVDCIECDQMQYPSKCGLYKVSRIIDLTCGKDIDVKDNIVKKPELPISTSSQMIVFYLMNGNIKLILRTSGTEPKIKCYIELIQKDYKLSQLEEAKLKIDHLLESVLKDFYDINRFKFEVSI